MRVLALGAHPDDIEFGCGGTLLQFAQKGHEVFIYVATWGELGGSAEIRKAEQESSVSLIGVKEIFWGGYTDCELNLTRELIVNVESVINRVKPDYIFVHNQEDTHQDHRALSTATLSATRYIPNFLFYEGPTTVNFSPNVYIDIDNYISDKLKLLAVHASQVKKVNVNMPEISILEIANSVSRFRGIQGRLKNAEAFKSLRLFINIPEIISDGHSGAGAILKTSKRTENSLSDIEK